MQAHRSDKAEMADPEILEPDEIERGAELIRLAAEVDPLLSQWARFRDRFALAMSDGFWTIDDLEQKIAHRRAFFFPGADAAIIGQIEVYPGGKRVFQLLWVTGEIAELVGMLPGVEAMARMMGCEAMLIEGRPAWKRILEANDYRLWSVTLHKAL
jgi:hypothetical protein